MAAPQDTRGIVDPSTLLTHVHFRRHLPAPPLRPYIDRYWLIDWDLPTPYTSRVIPHPAVNITFQWDEDGGAPYAELTGIPRGLYTRTLTGRGRVCGVKFRPGAIRAFAPGVAAGWWTARVLGLDEAVEVAAGGAMREATVRGAVQPEAVRDAARNPPRDPLPALDLTTPGDDETRVAVLDAHFLALPLTPDPQIPLATRLVAQIRETREFRKVSDVADAAGLSPRSLQRLFATHVGVTPKWTILRYRLHEALDQAAHAPDWPTLAADLGYADQSHLIRAFTKTVGVPPEAYVQTLR
ncbi:helix-turn-helix domain-containing protein [Streptomyces acidiscabies]|uniref:AraC family transcriptional regulator n=1 Tax=Streptomyces acidiscabies TaxID=42234 RepID=A0A0L0JUK6_9ACTN|nr:helix-turn-helix domain-containing protein [Streptomyces acidiscabies]KND29159.1 AraC family transcriptional regulator [Streptomyces acidiscabies]